MPSIDLVLHERGQNLRNIEKEKILYGKSVNIFSLSRYDMGLKYIFRLRVYDNQHGEIVIVGYVISKQQGLTSFSMVDLTP